MFEYGNKLFNNNNNYKVMHREALSWYKIIRVILETTS